MTTSSYGSTYFKAGKTMIKLWILDIKSYKSAHKAMIENKLLDRRYIWKSGELKPAHQIMLQEKYISLLSLDIVIVGNFQLTEE